MSNFVSVVIPLYNARTWIVETLATVARQTYPRDDLEVIVVDDASSDDSPTVARSALEESGVNGCVVSHEHRQGVSAARNSGWQYAHGEWIQFLDADDLLATHKVELQVRQAVRADSSVGVIYSPWQHYAEVEGEWQPAGPLVQPHVSDDPVPRILEDVSFGYVGPTLIRKACLIELEGFDEHMELGEDLDLMLRIAMSGRGFCLADSAAPAFFYRMRAGSLWRESARSPQTVVRLLHRLRAAETFLRDGRAAPLRETTKLALASRYARWLDLLFDNDPEVMREVVNWLRGLDAVSLPDSGQATRLVSRVVGLERSVRLRSSYRRARGWLSRQTSRSFLYSAASN
jgi:glycosyltransferase involved in cell wall biosynthesis